MSPIRRFNIALCAAAFQAAALGLGGCSGTAGVKAPNTASIAPPSAVAEAKSQKTDSVKIALLLPLSGPGEPAEIARAMKQAAEMALFDANDPAVQLISKDDGGTPEGAARAAEAAIAEGAEIVLGPLFAKSVTAIAPAAREAGVPIVAFSNDPNVAGNGVYLMSFLASMEVDRVVSYAASKGKLRFAALIPASPYGQTVEPAFRKAVAKAQGEIVRLESYPADASGMLAAAKRIVTAISEADKAGSPVDALFLPAGEETISQLGPLLTYSGIDGRKVKLIGTSVWDMPVIARNDALIGGWYAASDPSAGAQFSDRYRTTYHRDAPRLAKLAYDAMTVALSLSKGPKGERYSAANLTRPEGFAGVDGPIRLDANGLTERGLAVLEIEKFRPAVIDNAAQPSATGKVSATPGLAKFF